MQLAGWNVNQPVVAQIESGKRTLLDYELQFFLDIFGKDWKDVAREGLEPTNVPKPRGERQHHFGKLIRQLRNEAGLSQEKLAVKLQLAGWDVDRAVVVRIECGQRPLLDYELKFILDALGVGWDDIFRK